VLQEDNLFLYSARRVIKLLQEILCIIINTRYGSHKILKAERRASVFTDNFSLTQ